ncbi:hypothetical protein Gorai_006351 [Gossypium raimondii]|uniref:Uncharacterized protein n=1 Tax=Gossypium raimondii TaxID=29730 RepID=A0A7J8QFS5_GOSRA|nr:hypothetical protein [Gossypium raimondii]
MVLRSVMGSRLMKGISRKMKSLTH